MDDVCEAVYSMTHFSGSLDPAEEEFEASFWFLGTLWRLGIIDWDVYRDAHEELERVLEESI